MRHGLDAHSCCHHGGHGGARVRRTRIRTSVRGTPICGAVGHTASLDDGTCATDTIATGQTQALVFSAPGTYPYHCAIHPSRMKGTITITG
jgi:hypothetical protein